VPPSAGGAFADGMRNGLLWWMGSWQAGSACGLAKQEGDNCVTLGDLSGSLIERLSCTSPWDVLLRLLKVPVSNLDLVRTISCCNSVPPLLYKPESRGFHSRWCHWNFSWTESFRPHYGPGVDSASDTQEYQGYLLHGKGGWCVGLTTLSP